MTDTDIERLSLRLEPDLSAEAAALSDHHALNR
jgi:hypothetical protein